MNDFEKEFFLSVGQFRQRRFEALETEYGQEHARDKTDPASERRLFERISALLGPDKNLLIDYSDTVVLNHYRDLHWFYNRGFEDCAAFLSCCRKACEDPMKTEAEQKD